MGKLPMVAYADRITKSKQTKFQGLEHTRAAKDGELYTMRNMSSQDYPLLATRQQRRLKRTLATPNGIFGWDGLAWVDGDKFFFDGVEKGTVTDSRKHFAGIGAYLIIMPDKKYYNTHSGEFGSIESEWTGVSLTFTNGTLYGEAASRNAIKCTGVDWTDIFNIGDAVSISGCTAHPENNKSTIIREIAGDTMHFYENVFTLDGDEQDQEYTENGSLALMRSMPDLVFMCENENRLWGCSGNTIYASKLGDIFNWNVFDGLDTDSYAVDTGSAGEFTGCVSYLGYPTFFKENNIYKVYGSLPSNFEVTGSATLGLSAGSNSSMANAGERLYYLSRAGFVMYTGGIPAPIKSALGNDRQRNAVGGSDGLKYYVSCQLEDDTWRLYVYDTQVNSWHIEDEMQVLGFANYQGNLYFLASDGKLWITGNIINCADSPLEEAVNWMAEFSDFTADEPNKKGASKIQIRLELGNGANAQAWIQYDSSGTWEKAGKEISCAGKRSYYLPVIPHRCDHYRIKITGKGECRIYSIAREYYVGSPLRSQHGRN